MDNSILIGAIAGDVIGSVYEFCPCRSTDFKLFYSDYRFTDDTEMTVAIADWLLTGNDLVKTMQKWGRKYPFAGYGQRFMFWLAAPNPQPAISSYPYSFIILSLHFCREDTKKVFR